MRLLLHSWLVAAVIVAIGPAGIAFGQSAAAPADEAVAVAFAYSWEHDRTAFEFANPSNFDTPFLVPHRFVQSYEGLPHWLEGTVAYRALGDRMATTAGIAIPATRRGSDFDTFFNPGGDVIVYGTGGDVRPHAFRLGHTVEGRLGRVRLGLGYAYQRVRAQFLPADRVVTHSQPPSEIRSPTFGHETTIAEVHRIPLSAEWPGAPLGSWRIDWHGEVSPLVWARLTTRLPDKYPGQDIVFEAKAIGAGGGARLRPARSLVAVDVRYTRTFNYRDSAQVRDRRFAVSLWVGRN